MAQKNVSGMGEIGRSGLAASNGQVHDEFLPALRGSFGRRTLREMADNSPIVGGIFQAFEKVILGLDWRFENPENAEGYDEATTEFVQQCFEDMSDSWPSALSSILTMNTYGWSFHEIVYKKRNGDSKDAGQRSKFSDGRIGWRKWPIRSQDSLMNWVIDDSGGIQAMVQAVSTGGTFEIPMEKALLFRTSSLKNNPEGRSLLRNAYRPWYFVKRIEEIEAIGIERDLAGLPVAWISEEYFGETASPAHKQIMQVMQDVVRNIKRNENEGILMPLSYNDDGNKMMDLTLLSSGGSRQFDTDKIVARYNQQIAMSMLADFIMLGHENVGSQSLGVSKIELWLQAVDAIANNIAEVINTHAVPRLLRLNGMDTENPPRLVYGTVGKPDLVAIGGYVKTLYDAGVLAPDEDLEDYLRGLADLPPVNEDEREERHEEALTDPLNSPEAVAAREAAKAGLTAPPLPADARPDAETLDGIK